MKTVPPGMMPATESGIRLTPTPPATRDRAV